MQRGFYTNTADEEEDARLLVSSIMLFAMRVARIGETWQTPGGSHGMGGKSIPAESRSFSRQRDLASKAGQKGGLESGRKRSLGSRG